MMKKLMIVIVLTTLAFGGSALAALEDMNLVYDTYVDQENPADAYGNVDVLRLQNPGERWDESGLFPVLNDYLEQRIFLQFDLSAILANAILTDGVFGIYSGEVDENLAVSVQLWDIKNNAWDNSLTWDGSQTLLGGQVQIGLVQSFSLAGNYWEWAWSDLNSWDYTDALADGKVSFMLTMQVDSNNSTYAVFNSDENDNFHPYLKLEYIPEPATLSLLALGMGSLTMVRRKR